MPSGYTAQVQDGTITEFSDFAMSCARAFGALITMRDDPADAPIPEKFEPSTSYYDGALERARKTLAEVEVMTPEQCDKEAAAQHRDALEDRRKRCAEKDVVRERYTAMLAKVEAWEPPSSEHVEMKSFMAKQLRDSIDWDCKVYGDDPKPITGADWRAFQLTEARRTIKYNEAERAKEIERVEGRSRWVRQLRASLSA
jgi:hypothetical protein